MTTNPGANIKYLRLLNNMSQEELGKRVGVQRAAINKYEKGSVTNIPLTTIEKIANVFNVSPTYIVGWHDRDSNPLSAEVKVLQGVQKFYGKDTVELIESYVQLNSIGRQRVIQYIEEINLIYTSQRDDIN